MPASGQHTTGSKADIFTPVDIGGANGAAAAQDEEAASIQNAMSEEVDKRMNKALDDLKDKYKDSVDENNVETSEHGPSGAAYKQKQAEQDKAMRAADREARAAEERRSQAVRAQAKTQYLAEEEGVDSDDELLDEYDQGDEALRELREKRLAQMKRQHAEKLDNLQKGHGRYVEIAQDEFLRDVLGSKNAVVHFYHKDFENCKVMDHHLAKLAPQHIEAKFVKLNAEKAPFFVEKLQVRVMPTTVIFKDGLATARIVGFDGLADDCERGKENEFKTEALALWLAKAGAIEYEHTASEAELAKYTLAGARAAAMVGCNDHDEDYE